MIASPITTCAIAVLAVAGVVSVAGEVRRRMELTDAVEFALRLAGVAVLSLVDVQSIPERGAWLWGLLLGVLLETGRLVLGERREKKRRLHGST